MKHRDGIKQILGKSLQYTNTFYVYYGRNINRTKFYITWCENADFRT